jgi:hypothetical protein
MLWFPNPKPELGLVWALSCTVLNHHLTYYHHCHVHVIARQQPTDRLDGGKDS